VQGHQASLGAEPDGEQQEHHHREGGAHLVTDEPAGDEGEFAGLRVDDDHRQQHERATGEQVAEVGAARADRLGITLVGHQGVGGDGEQLIGDEEGEQVPGEGHGEGRGETQAVEGVEPGLVRGVVAAHVPDGVAAGEHPQEARQHGEQHPHPVDGQGHLDAR